MLILVYAMSPSAEPVDPLSERILAARERSSKESLDAILAAIRSTETGGQQDEGSGAIGDGGRAIGPYQIHRAYFIDAGVEGRYEDCRDGEFSRRVVIAYWRRWCPDALERCDAEVLARVHNGGPRGASKCQTLRYWRKVERRLEETALETRGVSPSANNERAEGTQRK
jgi:hypothetical protein